MEKRRGIWYRRHCFRSAPFSLLFSPRSPPCRKSPHGPSTSLRRAAPIENYPLQRGVPAIQATFSSLLCFSSRVLPHIDYNITTYPSFRLAAHPFFCRISPFFSQRPPPRRYARPLLYTCTSDHNINFNDGHDENIRTPRYLWRLSWLPSASFSRIRGRVNPLPSRTIF